MHHPMPTQRTDLTEVPTKRKPSVWKQYADGTVWEFLPDTDFTSDPQAFSNAARQWGYNNKYSVSTSVTPDDHVYVQFMPNPDAKPRRKATAKKDETAEQPAQAAQAA